MGLEIRSAASHEMRDFQHAALTSLVLSPEVMPPEVIQGINPDWTLCAFVDGKLATSYAAWPFSMQIDGVAVPIAGITCVGTLPIHRGRGQLRKIVTRHFEMLHERAERPLALLYASRAAIYQRFGFAAVSTRNSYSVDPRDLHLCLPDAAHGVFRELRNDEWSLLADLYEKFRKERNGYVKRGKGSWMIGLLREPAQPGHFLNRIVYEEDGNPTGYAIYTSEPLKSASGMPLHRIHIRDLVWLTPSAYRATWDFFSRMKLADSIVWDRVPPDDPLPHLLNEPRMLNLTSTDGMLGRIVDVGKALAARKYAADGVLTCEISDDLCPWNVGRWRLEASGGASRSEKTMDAPELAMPVGTLAMLLFGQISATEAARMGRLHVHDEGAPAKWDNMMRTKYKPFCADMF